jgi:phospholipase/carboxylesterase
MLKYIEENTDNADLLVFFLHGYGSNEKDLMSLGTFLRSSKGKVGFVSLRAPESCNGYGYQWFPLNGVPFPIRENVIREKKREVIEIIEQHSVELADFVDKKATECDVKRDNVFLLGFSQGSMISLYAGLRMKEKIGGIISCSGLIMDDEDFFENGDFCKQNVLFLYGSEDNCIGGENFVRSKNLLEKYLGNSSKIIEYPGLGHSVNYEELEDIKRYFFC